MQPNNSYTANEFTISNWKHYCELAAKTESIPVCNFEKTPQSHVIITRLLHAVLGIGTELAELQDAIDARHASNIIEEVGDIFWYLAIIENSVPLPKLNGEDVAEFTGRNSLFWLGEMQDVVKRAIYYGEDLFARNKKGIYPIRRLALAVLGISHCLQEVNELYINQSQTYILEANIIKLSKRYPELMFKATDALDRDTVHELSHIVEPTMAGSEAKAESEAMLNARAELVEDSKPTVEELFTLGTLDLLDGDQFNKQLREQLTSNQIEVMAMALAFNTATMYRAMGADGIARGYDALYSTYSGRGDKLEDFSCYVMWQFLAYPLDWKGICDKLVELKVYG